MLFADSDYEEVPGPHASSIRRELVQVLRGRFCFRLGAGVRCGGGASYTISKGETRSLELSLGLTIPLPAGPNPSMTGRIEYTHTFTEQIGPWPVGPCDSIFPALCFDNAELRRYRYRRPIRRFELSAFKEEFEPGGDPGWAHPNKLTNDVWCDCHSATEPSTIDASAVRSDEHIGAFVVLRPIAFVPTSSEMEPDDPMSAARELLELLTDVVLGDDDGTIQNGPTILISRADGSVVPTVAAEASETPTLVMLPWGVASVARRLLTFERGRQPLVAVGGPSEAAYCDVGIHVAQPGRSSFDEVERTQAPMVANEWLSVVWHETDLGEIPAESTGYVEVQPRRDDGTEVGYPLREPFLIDPLTLTGSKTLEAAF